jgi:hypothetical protein
MKKTLLQGIFYLTMAVLFLSCATKRPALIPTESTVNVKQEGLVGKLSFRDDDWLKREFGTDTNPYRTEYTKLQFRRRMVFDLTLENSGTEGYRFRLADCELQYGGKTVRATNAFQFINEWQTMANSPKIAAQVEPIIKKTLLPSEKVVPAGASLRGFLLFQGNLPGHGTAQVFIPGVTSGSPLQFDFEF